MKKYYFEVESACDPDELEEILELPRLSREQPSALKSWRYFRHIEELPEAGGDIETRARAELERIQWLKNHVTQGQMDILVDRVARLAELSFEMGKGQDPRKSRYEFEEDPALSPTEKRLLELLTINDERVYSARAAENKIKDELEEQKLNWAWAIHKATKEDPRPELPLPRLELQCSHGTYPEQGSWSSLEWLYCLVYKSHWGDVLFVPLGLTTVRTGGAEPVPDGMGKDEPFREAHHIRTDMKTFGLPAYIVIEELKVLVPIKPWEECRDR